MGAIVHACFPLQRQERIVPLTTNDLPLVAQFAGALLERGFPLVARKRQRALPSSPKLVKTLAEWYRQDVAAFTAIRLTEHRTSSSSQNEQKGDVR